VATGKTFGSVESVKAVSEIYAPPARREVREEGEWHAGAEPDAINTDPHPAEVDQTQVVRNPGEVNARWKGRRMRRTSRI